MDTQKKCFVTNEVVKPWTHRKCFVTNEVVKPWTQIKCFVTNEVVKPWTQIKCFVTNEVVKPWTHRKKCFVTNEVVKPWRYRENVLLQFFFLRGCCVNTDVFFTSEIICKNTCFFLFCFFFFYQGFLSQTLTTHRTAGEGSEGGDHLLFHSTTSTRSRTFRYLFASLHVR